MGVKMAFTIVGQMLKPGPNMFYEPKFRHILELHLNQLKVLNAVRKPIPADEYYQYEGDFDGFLLNRGYQAEMFWLMCRVNNMTHPSQFGKSLRDPYSDGKAPVFIEPHPNAIAELQQYYLTLRDRS